MAGFDVSQMNSEVTSSFNALKSSADKAITNLNNFAQFNDAGIYYRRAQSDGTIAKNDFLYKENTFIPIEAVKSADSIIAEIEALTTQISAVTFNPPTNVPNFQMEDHKIWKDALADQIETSISSYITTMGIPDKSYQDAIFNESFDRNLQSLNDLYNLADAKVGARGFTYTNDQGTILKLDAQQKYQFDRNQINRDITKLVTEWARQNYQFAIDKGIAFEQFHADFTVKYCTAFVDIYKSMIMVSIERFKAELGKYVEPIKALVEAAKLPVEVDKINADISKANAELNQQSNKIQIDEAVNVFQGGVNSSVATFTQQIKALEAVAAQTASFIQAASRTVIGIGKA